MNEPGLVFLFQGRYFITQGNDVYEAASNGVRLLKVTSDQNPPAPPATDPSAASSPPR